MANIKQFFETLRAEPGFIRTVKGGLPEDYVSDLKSLGIDAQNRLLVPIYKGSLTTPDGKPRLPDGYLMLSKPNGEWKAVATYKNQEPQVL